jgi:hypothetical protein
MSIPNSSKVLCHYNQASSDQRNPSNKRKVQPEPFVVETPKKSGAKADSNSQDAQTDIVSVSTKEDGTSVQFKPYLSEFLLSELRIGLDDIEWSPEHIYDVLDYYGEREVRFFLLFFTKVEGALRRGKSGGVDG